MAGQANFAIVKGDTFTRNSTFRNKASQVAVNLTGSTIVGKIKLGSTAVDLTCTITSAVNGQFRFGLTSTQTSNLLAGIYTIEVQITYSDLTVQTLFNGNFIVKEQTV